MHSVYFKSNVPGRLLFRKVIQDCLIIYEDHAKTKRFEFSDCDASLKFFNRLEEYAIVAYYCNAAESKIELSCFYRFSSRCMFASLSHLYFRFDI